MRHRITVELDTSDDSDQLKQICDLVATTIQQQFAAALPTDPAQLQRACCVKGMVCREYYHGENSTEAAR